MILPESEPQTSHTASESFQRPSELVEKKNEVVPSESVLKINYVSALCGLRHPSCVVAVHHSFTEIDLHHIYILHNIRSIYMHIRRRDLQAICIMCLPPSFCTLK